MKLKALSSSMLLALVPVSGAYAAAMDRSGQSISAFLQPNNYFEAGISALSPDVAGKTKAGANINDMADDYHFPSAALKVQAAEKISFGLIYDQPFGAKATFDPTETTILGGTEVDVKTQSLSMIFGFQPIESLNFYGGGVYQRVKGELTLAGNETQFLNGYNAVFKEGSSTGWLAGAAFQIPDIALKASITYRSEIDHDLTTTENPAVAKARLTGYAASIQPVQPLQAAQINALAGTINSTDPSEKTRLSTPQSVNLDFQTGIMADTVAFANIRWVNWEKTSIRPDKFNQISKVLTQLQQKGNGGFDLLQYQKDQWSVNAGVGRKLSEKWAGTASVGWDSGAGNPVTVLGPTEGYWNVGLGAQFSPTPSTFIAGGVKYFWLGDAKGQLASQAGTTDYIGTFDDNTAFAFGLKVGYKF